MLQIQMMDLGDSDHLYIYDASDLDTQSASFDSITAPRTDRSALAVLSGNSSAVGSDAHAAVSRNYRSKFGGRLLLVMNTQGGNGDSMLDSRGAGFDSTFVMLPRLADMIVSDTAFTNNQYAIGFLEFQMADVGALSATRNTEELFESGNGVLGPVSMAERCFMSCSGLIPYFQQLQRVHEDPTNLPLWHRRPPKEQVGRDEFVGSDLATEVLISEIPSAVRYMGYTPEHFVRTAYVSRFPPGAFKAPLAHTIGHIDDWGALGDHDPSVALAEQPTRAMLPAGLEVTLVGDAFSWQAGWAQSEGDREGKQWWDDDGASDEFAPEWQILRPAGAINDARRFAYDLESPDLSLYSFIDSQRRIVMANTLAQAVPCGMLVNSSCEVSCEVQGTGLNRLQCITRTLKTRCGQPVVDECNNDCGIRGQHKCTETAVALGSVRIGSTGLAASSSFALGVGRVRSDKLPDNALYLSHQDVTRAGVSQEVLVGFSHPLMVVDGGDTVLETFTRFAFEARLQSDSKSYQMILKLLTGSWLKDTAWNKCQEHPPRCGDIEKQLPQGWLTAYQVGHTAWPSCSDFSMQSQRASTACADIDINFRTRPGQPGLFDIFDRDESGYLDRSEMEVVHAELEARRRVAEKEVWSRLHMSQRDLFKIVPLGAHDASVATGLHGFEFASPHCASVQQCADVRFSTTLRISSWSEFLGEYMRLGQSRHVNVTTCVSTHGGLMHQGADSIRKCGWHLELQALSHVHMDAPIQGACPLQLSGGSESHHTTVCLDAPTDERLLLLPDTSGMLITTANLADISSLVGLRGNRTMQYTGEAHSHSQQWKYSTRSLLGPRPPQPRLDCSTQNCSQGAGASRSRTTFEFEYASYVWHAVDLAVLRQAGGVWLPKLPAYFSFVCPHNDPTCDIIQHMGTIRAQFGVSFQKTKPPFSWQRQDGYDVSSSPWPNLNGNWQIPSPNEYADNPGQLELGTHWLLSPADTSTSSGVCKHSLYTNINPLSHASTDSRMYVYRLMYIQIVHVGMCACRYTDSSARGTIVYRKRHCVATSATPCNSLQLPATTLLFSLICFTDKDSAFFSFLLLHYTRCGAGAPETARV